MNSRNREVVFTTIDLPHYRIGFHRNVAERLRAKGINYKLVHSDKSAHQQFTEQWSIYQPCLPFLKPFKLYAQPLPPCCNAAELLVLGQENRIISNLPLLFRRDRSARKIALFGHGRNYQSRRPHGKRERLKAHYTKKADWFFAYTDGGAEHLIKTGFPRAKITSVHNAIDMRAYLTQADQISEIERAKFVQAYLNGSQSIGLFVGRFYKEKRLEFLVRAAQYIRQQIPDFQLVLIGQGPERLRLERQHSATGWIHFVDGDDLQENARYLSAAHLQLAPGLVGLNILDGFAFGLPLLTRSDGRHSPEIEYLSHNQNGRIVDVENAQAYAHAAIDLFQHPNELARLTNNAKSSAYLYSQEHMAERFCNGVVQCLCAR
jgi:glycosyltransferase involved in cell wall biosynthesis